MLKLSLTGVFIAKATLSAKRFWANSAYFMLVNKLTTDAFQTSRMKGIIIIFN